MNNKYYGAKKIFGSVLEDAENPSHTLDSINYIDEEEINPKENSFNSLPASLQNAINYFIVEGGTHGTKDKERGRARHHQYKVCSDEYNRRHSF